MCLCMYLSVELSVNLPVYIYVNVSIDLSIYLHIPLTHLEVVMAGAILLQVNDVISAMRDITDEK